MFCTKCGKANADQSKFCEFCGEKLVLKVNINQNAMNRPVQNAPFPTGNVPGGVSGNTSARPKISKSTVKWVVLLIVQVVVTAVLICLAATIGNQYYSAKYIASQYFESLVNGHPEQAYEYISSDNESTFFSKEMFCSFMGPLYNGKLVNYKVKKTEEGFSQTEFKITYRLSGQDNDNVMFVTMDHLKKKKFLIFDQWKVSTEDICIPEFIIYAPQNAKVTLNSVELTAENTSKQYDEERGKDAYKISDIMEGEYALEVHKDNYQDLKTTLYIANDEEDYDEEDDEDEEKIIPSYECSELYLKEDVMNQLGTDAHNKFKSIIQAAGNGDFTSVINQCIADANNQTSASNQLRDIFPTDFKSIDVENVRLSVYDYSVYDEEDGYEGVVAHVEVKSTLNYKYQDSWGYESESYRDIQSDFYYKLDDQNNFVVDRINFDYD